jgi:catechol 2,3-dioxygenase-like lactoylglutathione lyase family enzyme
VAAETGMVIVVRNGRESWMRLDHVNIRTGDLDASTAFYRDIIGLEVGPRPGFSFAGAWLYHDGQAVVHLKCPAASNAEGAIEHVAFFTTAFDEVSAAIQARRIEHKVQGLPDGSLRQCFLRDPNGVLVEITGP